MNAAKSMARTIRGGYTCDLFSSYLLPVSSLFVLFVSLSNSFIDLGPNMSKKRAPSSLPGGDDMNCSHNLRIKFLRKNCCHKLSYGCSILRDRIFEQARSRSCPSLLRVEFLSDVSISTLYILKDGGLAKGYSKGWKKVSWSLE